MNKKNIHSIEYYNAPEAAEDLVQLGIKGDFVLLEVKYSNVVSDIIIYGSIDTFIYDLER